MNYFRIANFSVDKTKPIFLAQMTRKNWFCRWSRELYPFTAPLDLTAVDTLPQDLALGIGRNVFSAVKIGRR